MTRTKESYLGLEEALKIVRIVDRKSHFDEDRGIICGRIQFDSNPKLRLMEIIFGCKCEHQRGNYGFSGEPFYYHYRFINHYFSPTKVTNCPINLEEEKTLK